MAKDLGSDAENLVLQRKLEAQEKVIAALKKRVEKTTQFSNSHSSAYHAAAILEEKVKERTAELEELNTELRTALENERKLAADRDSALDASKTKSQFLANMSHEIRTPMNGVIGMTSLLEGTELSSEQLDFVRVIRTSGEALLSIINDILDFSKIEAKKLDIEQHPFSLSDCVHDALGVISPIAAEKGLEIVFQQDADFNFEVVSDVTRIRQVLVNLLSNAVKFTESGEVVLALRSEKLLGENYRFYFDVKDTGIGISESQIERLFDAFSQADVSTTRKFGGTGLGLAISSELAALLGGGLTVESTEGEGSTFTFSIVARAKPEDVSYDVALLDGKRALIVDDNDTNRRILSEQLRRWGMDAVCASDAYQAINRVEEQPNFDVAILDYHMPKVDGLELAKRLKSNEASEGLPIVVLSSIGERPRESKTVISHWLAKPVLPQHLVRQLISIVSGKTAHSYAVPEGSSELTQYLASMSVLLAEDNKVNQLVVKKMLSQMGVDVDVAENGVKALEAIETKEYQVVLMDMMMPEMDGVEATKRIRSNDRIHQPVIIALTANAMDSHRQKCLDVGMDDFLTKPMKIEDLKSHLLSAYQMLRQRKRVVS